MLPRRGRERRLAPAGEASQLGRGRLRIEEPERAQRLESFLGFRLGIGGERRVRIGRRRAAARDPQQIAEARLDAPAVADFVLREFASSVVANGRKLHRLGPIGKLQILSRDRQPEERAPRDVDLFICPGTAVPGVPPQLCTGSATNASRANDEDIFFARVGVPGGGGNNDEDNNNND